MEILALLIHLPSDRTSHMPWRAALISANAPQHSIEDTDSTYFYVCDGASPKSAQLGTRHGAANEPERSRRAPKKIVSPLDSWVWRPSPISPRSPAISNVVGPKSRPKRLRTG